MALKQYKPTSTARRGLILVDKSALWKGKPVKALTEGKRKTGGRNNKGHVTSRGHICAGRRPRPRNGHRPPELRRAALHPLRLHGDGRRRVESRQRQHQPRQGRP